MQEDHAITKVAHSKLVVNYLQVHNFKGCFMEDTPAKTTKVAFKNDLALVAVFRP